MDQAIPVSPPPPNTSALVTASAYVAPPQTDRPDRGHHQGARLGRMQLFFAFLHGELGDLLAKWRAENPLDH